ncbi:hypothetical protein SCG7109_BK_00030 [Chlamydiales bacterium SCGC AG-110-M15]|nr:hypothetical protein SCG7109_BK_00030 [Chlamydiales bacterium SCGC AG-110-M15]
MISSWVVLRMKIVERSFLCQDSQLDVGMDDIRDDSPQREKPPPKRRFISIYWSCCHCFSRIYKNQSGAEYTGYCPKCRSYLAVPVGKGGTTQRIFRTRR